MGYASVLVGSAISWSSKLQPRISLIHRGQAPCAVAPCQEGMFPLLSELCQLPSGPVVLFGNNQGANALSCDPQSHNRTGHLRLTKHFICKQVKQVSPCVDHILTARMEANVMTQSLPAPAFLGHCAALGSGSSYEQRGVAADAAT
ncbi:hypothetical protein JCM8547_003588 [Rhodosporidiobolus lusitaniae]